MTDLTARELMDTILRSLAETRASFKKTVPPSQGDQEKRETQKANRSEEAANLENK
jgi:hypothetical protein